MLTYEKITDAFWKSMKNATVAPELRDMANDPAHHLCALPQNAAAAYTAALAKWALFPA